MKPVPADLSQLKAYSQYFPVVNIHANHMEHFLFPLNRLLLISMEIKNKNQLDSGMACVKQSTKHKAKWSLIILNMQIKRKKEDC